MIPHRSAKIALVNANQHGTYRKRAKERDSNSALIGDVDLTRADTPLPPLENRNVDASLTAIAGMRRLFS